jgi:hypothetical protein
MPLLVWGASGALAFVAARATMTAETIAYMPYWWARGFVPWNADALPWGILLVYAAFRMVGGWWVVPAAFPLAVLGCRHLRGACLPYVLPAALMYVAAAAHFYPFGLPTWEAQPERVIIGLLPGMCLLVAAGVAKVVRDVRWAGYAALAYLLATVAVDVSRQIPDIREDIRPALAHIAEHRQPGDVLNLGWFGPSYVPYYGAAIADMDTVSVPDIIAAGRRVWLVRAWGDTIRAPALADTLGTVRMVDVPGARWVRLVLYDP